MFLQYKSEDVTLILEIKTSCVDLFVYEKIQSTLYLLAFPASFCLVVKIVGLKGLYNSVKYSLQYCIAVWCIINV